MTTNYRSHAHTHTPTHTHTSFARKTQTALHVTREIQRALSRLHFRCLRLSCGDIASGWQFPLQVWILLEHTVMQITEFRPSQSVQSRVPQGFEHRGSLDVRKQVCHWVRILVFLQHLRLLQSQVFVDVHVFDRRNFWRQSSCHVDVVYPEERSCIGGLDQSRYDIT